MLEKYPFPELVLFDWDNTLIDSTPGLYEAYCVLKQHFDLPDYTMKEYQVQTGRSLRETFPNLFGDDWEKAKEIFVKSYQEKHLEMLDVFEDALNVIEFLHKKVGKVGVVSNKTGFLLRKEITHLGWDKYFCTIVGAGDAKQDKPNPDPVFMALNQAGIKVEDNKALSPVWFIGDGDADIACAKASGCLPIRMAEEDKDGPEVLRIKNCTELLSFLYSYA